MKIGWAVFVAAILCLAVASAHEAPPLDEKVWLEQKEGPGEGKALFSEIELQFSGWHVEPRTWYTLVDFKCRDHLACLGTKKSTSEGKVRICSDLEREPRHLALVLTKDVDCDEGKMVKWHPDAYLFEEHDD